MRTMWKVIDEDIFANHEPFADAWLMMLRQLFGQMSGHTGKPHTAIVIKQFVK